MRVILLSLIYPLQYPLVCFVQRLRQFIQILAEVWGEAMLQHVQLAEYPSEPVRRRKNLQHSHPIGSFRQRLDH